jgi:hypothetical protein
VVLTLVGCSDHMKGGCSFICYWLRSSLYPYFGIFSIDAKSNTAWN